jgi:transposase-like protein
MTPKQTSSEKRKRVHLTLTQKLQLIRKLEAGASVSSVCEEFGVKKQTVSDIRKSKDKLTSFALKFSVDKSPQSTPVGDRKHMRLGRDMNIENAVYKWYTQQRASGVNIRGVDIQSAAVKLAKHMETKFEASDGWLWRFRNRHGIGNRVIFGEAGNTPMEEVESFRGKLNEFMRNRGYHIMADEEIAEEVLAGDDEVDSDEEIGQTPVKESKLSLILESLDNIINYIDASNEPGVQPYYEHFCTFREIIIRKHYGQGTQLTVDSFFRPTHTFVPPPKLQPSTSGTTVELNSSTDSE